MQKKTSGKLFILFGPSAAGKTTLLEQLLQRLPAGVLAPVITYTSRSPRPGEVNGKDYCFISPEDFQEKLNEGFFIHTTNYLDNHYGCSKIIFQELKEGKNLIAIFDRAGAQEVKNSIPGTILIFITSSIDELVRRLKLRYENNPAQYASRFAQAQQDIAREATHKIYDYEIVNIDFEHALQELQAIIKKEISL